MSERLRRATAADVPGITRLMREAYGVYVPRLGAPPPPMLGDYAAEIKSCQAWVVEGDDNPKGALFLKPQSDHMLLVNIAVGPRFQGQGLGRTLLAKAESESRRQGFAEMRLFTHAEMVENIALYSRNGWTEYDRSEQAGVPRVFMRKNLK